MGAISICVGYRPEEIPQLSERLEVREDVQFFADLKPSNFRRVESVGVMPWKHSVAPHVDSQDTNTRTMGLMKRIGAVMPEVKDPNFYSDLKEYVLTWLKARQIRPLTDQDDLSFETWLTKTNYPLWRREELIKVKETTLKLNANNGKGDYRHFGIKIFTKDETYVDYKHARLIFARSDAAKCYFGPYFKAIEERIFDLSTNPEFVKHVPVAERGRYVYDKLFVPGAKYIATDYSSFEAHFTKQLQDSCEMVLYKYMLENRSDFEEVFKTMRETLTGRNDFYGQNVEGSVKACRMSGEMNTSLGNGFTNLMLMSYICHKLNLPCNGVVEGDDGLFSFPDGYHPTSQHLRDIGCNIKLEEFDELNQASFCGLVFDLEDKEVITEPIDVLSTIGWLSRRYLMSRRNTQTSILRAKALSALCQYPACPLVSELARKICTLTKSYDIRKYYNSRNVGWWERTQLEQVLKDPKFYKTIKPIGLKTRILVERVYGIPINVQLASEERIRNISTLDEIFLPELLPYVPKSYYHYANTYTWELQRENVRANIEFSPSSLGDQLTNKYCNFSGPLRDFRYEPIKKRQ